MKPEAGYYLIDFKGRWGSTSWNEQERRITELGPNFGRAHEAVVCEAVISVFKTSGELLLERWYHWGPSLGSYGNRVYIGYFFPDGLDVSGNRQDWDGSKSLRVCLFRKFRS